MSVRRRFAIVAACCGVTVGSIAHAQRQMEALDRGVVAVAQPDGKVFVSWRLLGTEANDLAFDVYRSMGSGEPTKLNANPLSGPTTFVDEHPVQGKVTYTVRAQGGQAEGSFTTGDSGATPYLTIPLQTPDGYAPGDASAADLDGDGRYDLVVKFEGRAKDNSQSGETDPVQLQAYTLDGKHLWTINLGPNIRGGAHYTQFQVEDYNGDGRAEVVCKTSDGTVDGAGKVIGNANAKYANERGYIQRGPEYLTVFDGKTGAAIDTITYVPARGFDKGNDASEADMKTLWGDGYGNRGDRFLAGTAWLDGVHPSIVMCRGYYTRSFLWALDFDGQHLKQRWLFDSENPELTKRNEITSPSSWNANRVTHGEQASRARAYSGQGYHSLSAADVDGDGKDEIIYGSMTVDDDGTGLYSTGWGHGDAIHVGDLDPENPGLEVFGIQERFDDAGAHMHDAKTGRPLWKKPSVKAADSGGDKGEGPGRGICADIDPRYPGSESWALGAGMSGMWDAKGNKISDVLPQIHLGATQSTFGLDATQPADAPRGRMANTCNFRIYWDGDLLDELLDKNQIMKWDWEHQTTKPLFVADGCDSNNGTKSTPALSADILGDWREELIERTTDNKSLRIYTTTIPTQYRRFTLMHDPQYRAAIAWQNTAYNQPPHVGVNMMDLEKGPPAKPNITLVKPQGATAAR